MEITKIRILPNYRKPWALRLAKTLSLFLKRHNFAPAHKNVDATICIGGDGTIFYANHLSRIQGAVLGIGSKTSMVCQLRKDNWKKYLIKILRSSIIEKRQKLTVKIKTRIVSSINDVVVHTHDYRVIRIFIEVNNKRYFFDGDGIIVSTPTGSTGYAYSAGGKILKTSAKKIQVIPICPYKRALKPIMVSDNVKISIFADRSSDLIIDGIFIRRLRARQMINIERGRYLEFLKYPDPTKKLDRSIQNHMG